MNKSQIYQFPYRLKSEANLGEHWRTKHQRHRKERYFLTLALKCLDCQLPVIVRLVRISARECDYDNLVACFKNIRDVVADLLIPGMPAGRADGDPRISWEYAQEKGRSAVRIEFIPLPEILPLLNTEKTAQEIEEIIHNGKKLFDISERTLAEMDKESKEHWLRRASDCLNKLKQLIEPSKTPFSSNKILC